MKEKDDTSFSQVHRTNVVDSGTPGRRLTEHTLSFKVGQYAS